MLKRISGLLLTVTALAVACPAAAHYVWIERDATERAALYFGEYQEQVREVSGGRLDKIRNPSAWRVEENGARQALQVARKGDRFDLGVVNATSAVIAEERDYEVMDLRQYGYGIAKPLFYTRLQPLTGGGDAKPQLDLDILPQARATNTFVVYFRNAPLAKTKVIVYAPNFWQQEHRTDDSGRVNISTPWPGQYVLEVLHTEKRAGEFRGTAFDTIRHRATLGFVTRATVDGR